MGVPLGRTGVWAQLELLSAAVVKGDARRALQAVDKCRDDCLQASMRRVLAGRLALTYISGNSAGNLRGCENVRFRKFPWKFAIPGHCCLPAAFPIRTQCVGQP